VSSSVYLSPADSALFDVFISNLPVAVRCLASDSALRQGSSVSIVATASLDQARQHESVQTISTNVVLNARAVKPSGGALGMTSGIPPRGRPV
jgi:hypothetical protein